MAAILQGLVRSNGVVMNCQSGVHTSVPLRTPGQVMQLERMGSSFQTRLSFMRQLLRRMRRENWQFKRLRLDLDAKGCGVGVYACHGPDRSYSLVAFMHDISPEQRTDRVIADAWDATFSLYDGVPDDADIERLRSQTPYQEAGRFTASELTLARANKSMRLFEHVVERLASGKQPDLSNLNRVGYLMRTTAVYGSGKFGCADREKLAGRPEMQGPFQAELLTVYLVRWLSMDLVNHVARERGKASSVPLDSRYARYLGIGNATGLGMAPFLTKYPTLINNWVLARETALARVRSVPMADQIQFGDFIILLDRARHFVEEWDVDDETQKARIMQLRLDLDQLKKLCSKGHGQPYAWDTIYRYAEETMSVEAQEFVVSLLLEQHGEIVDELAGRMSAREPPRLDPAMSLGSLLDIIEANYDWVSSTDFSDPAALKRFWYYSEEKLEPRVGDRQTEQGSEFEMPIGIARDVNRLRNDLHRCDRSLKVADFLLTAPEYRHVVWRVQLAPHYPYGEIRDNLLGEGRRPLDILRFKLAFFGVAKFDPKSDLWTRVNMYQGAPLPYELASWTGPEWVFPFLPANRIGETIQ